MWNATARNYGSGGAEHSDGDGLLSILAVAVPGVADGLELAPNTPAQSKSSCVRREYNPDPKVADYESAEEVMEIMLGT